MVALRWNPKDRPTAPRAPDGPMADEGARYKEKGTRALRGKGSDLKNIIPLPFSSFFITGSFLDRVS